MKIHALTTGVVRVKHSFLHPAKVGAASWTCSCPARSHTRCRSTGGRSSTTASYGSSIPADAVAPDPKVHSRVRRAGSGGCCHATRRR